MRTKYLPHSIALAISTFCGLCLKTLSATADNQTSRSKWVAAWADAPEAASGPAGAEQTFRVIIKPSVGSRGTIRLHFSNFFGDRPVTLGAVHVGLQTTAAAVSRDTKVTFAGKSEVTVPPHGFITSDTVQLSFTYGSTLAVTEFVTGSWDKLTQHKQNGGNVTSYATPPNSGDRTGDLSGDSFAVKTLEAYLLDRVEAYGDYKETIATFGSSTTDGVHSGKDTHQTWPEQLAASFHAAGHDDIAVANAGIAGNQVLADSTSPSGLSRFARDVLALPGVTAVIDYLGANDLRISCVAAGKLIEGNRELITRAHAAGLRIYLATTAPSTFCGKQNPHGFGTRFPQGSGQEAQRFALNRWERSTTPLVVDGVGEQPRQTKTILDFDKALVDPVNTSYMRTEFDSGDDIHPNAQGYKAMVGAIPLSLF